MRRGLRAALLLLLAGTLARGAPAEEEKKKQSEPEEKPDIILSTEADDRRAGEEAQKEVENELGILDRPELTEYVRSVGRRVARGAPGNFEYSFRIVDQEVPNAFALPGGFVFVSRGLLLLANSEDELANVLGHEIVHVASRHASARQHITRGVPGFFQFLQMGSLLAYGRDQERVADRLGQGLAGLAGYDPAAMAIFLRELEFEERLQQGSTRMPSFFDTHPSTGERVGEASARASRVAWTRETPIAPTRDDYLRRIDGLPVGMSVAEGVFQGQRFVHPEMGITLRFPEGWETRNTHTAVGAVSPARDAQVVLEGGGSGESLEAAAAEYLEKARREGLNVHEAAAVRLMGQPAFQARGTAGAGSLHVTLAWLSRGESIFRFVGTARSRNMEPVILNVVRSFRPLTPDLAGEIRERRLRIAPAAAGETLAQVSARAGNAWDLQTTAVMNGVATGQALDEGFGVKIAVDERWEPAPK